MWLTWVSWYSRISWLSFHPFNANNTRCAPVSCLSYWSFLTYKQTKWAENVPVIVNWCWVSQSLYEQQFVPWSPWKPCSPLNPVLPGRSIREPFSPGIASKLIHCQLNYFHLNLDLIIIKTPICLEFKIEVVPFPPFLPPSPDAP